MALAALIAYGEVPNRMGDANVGIDISAAQSSVPPGPWLFVVHKATEGHDYVDPNFVARFEGLRTQAPMVGAYHYARPGDGFTGAQQADFFAMLVLSAGFRKGVDMWQLDCEGTGNESVDAGTWDGFVTEFMATATALLGNRSFLYVGNFFVPEVFRLLVQHYNWWLPDYGPNNDGSVHPFGEALPAVPVLHQYTSAGGLDRNCVNNPEAWAWLTATPAPPKPAPLPAPKPSLLQRLAALIDAIRRKALRKGDCGDEVKVLQSLLRHRGYTFVAVNGDYDNNTVLAVALFKRSLRMSNLDGSVCGRACINALSK